MCLGIPGEVLSVPDDPLGNGRVCFGGIVKDVCFAYVPEARVGDFVVVHSGVAVRRLDPAEAARALAFLDAIDGLPEVGRGEG